MKNRYFMLFTIVLLLPRIARASFSYDDLTALIQQKQIKSVEQLLPELPPELRSNYVLVFDSRSLQPATPLEPRAILYGRDARLTCAFNGSSQTNSDTLECFQFLQNEARFDFRQISFPSKDNGLTEAAFSESGKTADGKVSCLPCHGGADARPNWDSYPYWPGAYGESDDFLTGESAKNYDAFVDRRSTSPRYKWLIQGTSRKAPYNGEVFEHTNLRFSDLVGRMNSMRAARMLEKAEGPSHALGFAAGALSCTATDEQKSELAKVGRDFAHDTNLEEIFAKLEMKPNDWSTHIFEDATIKPYPVYEQQSGLGFLSIGVAMSLIMERARAGNLELASAAERLRLYYSAEPNQTEKEYFDTLTSFQPDPDKFSTFYEANRTALCPAVTAALVNEATR